MLEAVRRLGTATGNLHRAMKATADAVGRFLVDAFHLLALFASGGTTVWSAVAAFVGMVAQGRATLSDILLLFIYLEIGAMVGIYFKTTHLPVRYLIYIAITALGRTLVEIVGAEHRTGIECAHGNGRNSTSGNLRLNSEVWFAQVSFFRRAANRLSQASQRVTSEPAVVRTKLSITAAVPYRVFAVC